LSSEATGQRGKGTWNGEATASDGEATASDGEATASDGEATASDGEATASDGEATLTLVSNGAAVGAGVIVLQHGNDHL
jgi:hypothetical protein